MRVLVYQIGQLGDTIVSVPALRAVRHFFGQSASIALLHDAIPGLVSSPMVLEGSGLVDEFISYAPEKLLARKLRTMASLWRRLRRKNFDVVVSLLPSDRPRRALLRDRLFFHSCGIHGTIGFSPFLEAEIRPKRSDGKPAQTPHEAVFRLRRLLSEGIVTPDLDLFALPLLTLGAERQSRVDAWLAARRRHPERPLIALCPGCKKPANSWPPDRFLEIARRLTERQEYELVILGGPAERDLARYLLSSLDGDAVDAVGCFPVTESAAVLARCSLLIGLDTGTSHLAAAVGVPCVVIQSANSYPGQWDPLGPGHSVLRALNGCSGCQLQACPKEDHPCMESLTVDAVWDLIAAALYRHERHASHSYV